MDTSMRSELKILDVVPHHLILDMLLASNSVSVLEATLIRQAVYTN